jgi:hypothetical protein
MSFDPHYLADALVIGATLHLVDGLNPGKTTDPSGNFCLVMNQRFDEESAEGTVGNPVPPATAMAA